MLGHKPNGSSMMVTSGSRTVINEHWWWVITVINNRVSRWFIHLNIYYSLNLRIVGYHLLLLSVISSQPANQPTDLHPISRIYDWGNCLEATVFRSHLGFPGWKLTRYLRRISAWTGTVNRQGDEHSSNNLPTLQRFHRLKYQAVLYRPDLMVDSRSWVGYPSWHGSCKTWGLLN